MFLDWKFLWKLFKKFRGKCFRSEKSCRDSEKIDFGTKNFMEIFEILWKKFLIWKIVEILEGIPRKIFFVGKILQKKRLWYWKFYGNSWNFVENVLAWEIMKILEEIPRKMFLVGKIQQKFCEKRFWNWKFFRNSWNSVENVFGLENCENFTENYAENVLGVENCENSRSNSAKNVFGRKNLVKILQKIFLVWKIL